MSLSRHTELLQKFVRPGHRLLEVGAGPGRFTEILHRAGARVVVSDISTRQLELNRAAARSRGFAASIEEWRRLDICDLQTFAEASFDGVIAFGGPLSYVFERRDIALAECIRVLRPGGYLLLSVMSLWGTLHRHLSAVREMPAAAVRAIIADGDLSPETDPSSRHHCHLFRATELRTFLDRPELVLEHLSASSALATGADLESVTEPGQFDALLEYERLACADPAYLDAGTHLLAAVSRLPSRRR